MTCFISTNEWGECIKQNINCLFNIFNTRKILIKNVTKHIFYVVTNIYLKTLLCTEGDSFTEGVKFLYY